jgi:hypothetical protein
MDIVKLRELEPIKENFANIINGLRNLSEETNETFFQSYRSLIYTAICKDIKLSDPELKALFWELDSRDKTE